MNTDQLERLREEFVAGKHSAYDVMLLLEPILVGAAEASADQRAAQKEARRLINAAEFAVFTRNEPELTYKVLGVVDEARVFVAGLKPYDPYAPPSPHQG